MAVLLGATALGWVLLLPLPLPARVAAVLLLVPLPALMVAQARMLSDMDSIPRTAAYLSSIGSLWALAAVVLTASVASDATWLVLRDTTTLVRDVAILTSAAIALLFLSRSIHDGEARILRALIPVTGRERLLFAAVALTAGVCEEIIYRGFLLHALLAASQSVPIAIAVSAGAFGIVHAYQGWRGAARAAAVGVVFATAVLQGATLTAVIIAHTLTDLLAGYWLAPRLLR